MLLSLPVFKKTCAYDVTIFQTPATARKGIQGRLSDRAGR